jgi:hypothetical protein
MALLSSCSYFLLKNTVEAELVLKDCGSNLLEQGLENVIHHERLSRVGPFRADLSLIVGTGRRGGSDSIPNAVDS